jgi:Family of unknown function (DUF6491)
MTTTTSTTGTTLGAALIAVLLSLGGSVLAQETDSDEASGVDARDAEAATLDHCVTVPGAVDMNVLDDRHVYIRTRGSNHYLLSTEQCDDLYRSYRRGDVRLVPYGRRVCENDGSYLVYYESGREQTCFIEGVQRVENRAEARELAEGQRALVSVDPVEVDDKAGESERSDAAPEDR